MNSFWTKQALWTFGVCLLGWGNLHAGETVRLGGTGSLKDAGATFNRLDLKADEDADADTTPIYWHRYRWRGFYGGYSYFYRPAFSYGFSYYRPAFGYGFYRPFNGFSYYRPFYPSYFYGFPGYSIYRPAFYGGFYSICHRPVQLNCDSIIELRPTNPAMPQIQEGNPTFPQQQIPQQQIPQLPNPQRNPMNPLPGDDTFPYDGGPKNPVPQPIPDSNPSRTPNSERVPPVNERMVSIPSTSTTTSTKKYSYPAYGEKPKTTELKPLERDEKLFQVNRKN